MIIINIKVCMFNASIMLLLTYNLFSIMECTIALSGFQYML